MGSCLALQYMTLIFYCVPGFPSVFPIYPIDSSRMQPLFAKKNRGQYKDLLLYPHLHSDGNYVATNTKYSIDYVRVGSVDELAVLVRSGYGARMSNPEIPQAPSFISNRKISFQETEEPLARVKSYLATFAGSEELDAASIARKRKEQVFLRTYLLRGKENGTCAICGKALPREMLVAAHIKPRSRCNRDEKLDFDAIAALMCTLGCDSLFEKGFVYAPNGTIEQNLDRDTTPYLNIAIHERVGRAIEKWSASSAYYVWHAKEFGWKKT